MTNPIKPTIGRNVWYYPTPGAKEQHANIIDVHSDTMVNLFTVNHGGTASSHTSVPFAGDGDNPTGPHWRWMPYQTGQAKAQAAQPMPGRPADVSLRMLEDNGRVVAEQEQRQDDTAQAVGEVS